MNPEIEKLQKRIEQMESQLQIHSHNGWGGGLVSFNDLAFTIKTVDVATDLTNIIAAGANPRKISEQIFIDTTTATKKLYIYDMVGKVWRSVAIA